MSNITRVLVTNCLWMG